MLLKSSLDARAVCMPYKTGNPLTYISVSVGIHLMPIKVVSSGSRSSWKTQQNLISCFSNWTQLGCLFSSASSLRLSGKLSHTIPKLTSQQRLSLIPRASKDVPHSFQYPPMTKKPQWWWRTLACLSYLMPIHETWMYAETAYHLHPLLEEIEFSTYPFLRAIKRLPSWFFIAYCIVLYLGVARRKEWPHFFRYHAVMGLLLEIVLQVMATMSRWMPVAVYWGKIGMHIWATIAFAFLFTVLECIWCVLAGMYADIPFLCDAAYIHSTPWFNV